MKDTIVIDLDGTLSNCDHRRHLVQGKKRDYEAFHAKIGEDPVNEWCAMLMERMSVDPECEGSGYKIIIVSARPWSATVETRRWLLKNHVVYDSLFLLRTDGDSTPDQDLKREWLHSYGKDRILFVVDDRSRVVKMWREEGLVCLQCDKWEEVK